MRFGARLLTIDPELVHATESWSWDKAVGASLRNAEDGTPLIRAVETGELSIVQLLLDAGGRSMRGACAGAQTPLWTAVSHAAAFAGSTPLHTAVHRQPQLVSRLLAAGAAPVPRCAGRVPA